MSAAQLFRVLLCCALCAPAGVLAEDNPEKTPEFRNALQRAIQTYNVRDYAATLEQCEILDKLKPDSALVLNMRGAIALEQRKFEDGERWCKKALEIDPKFFPARFNMAEIPFLQKRYSEARDIYDVLIAEDPKNELVQYRLFLTWLLEGNEANAEEALKKITFPGDTAAYYFAHAAWEFYHGHTAEGEGWVNSGDWVFSKSKNVYYADVLYDLGWLKRTTAPVLELKPG